MRLLKRIRNLWRLSEWEIENLPKDLPIGTKVSPLVKLPTKMAQIIKRSNPVQDFLEKTKE